MTHRPLVLAARGESPAAFERRCIPPGCVAPPSNIPDILGRHALPGGRLAVLGATPDFHHGLLEFLTNIFRVDDDVDDDVDEDDDFGDDDDEDDEDEDEGDDEEPETWQVSLKGGPGLTSGIELPRLAGICQLS
jgi:hypothetical protein